MAQPVAVLGLGLMGSRIARRLTEAGWPVAAWNRSPDRARALALPKVRIAADPADAVRDAEVVVTVLSDGAAVRDVLCRGPLPAAIRPGGRVVDMSSIAPAEARRVAARLAAAGIGYVDAPVSGGTAGAEAGALAIFVGGSAPDVEAVRPMLSVLGRPTPMGPVGAGQAAKLANQIVVGVAIAGLAEAIVFAEASGLDVARLFEAMRGGFADSRVLELLGPRMRGRDFAVRGRASTHLKDLRNAAAEAGPGAPALALTAATARLLEQLLAAEGDLDHGAMLLAAERAFRGARAGAEVR